MENKKNDKMKNMFRGYSRQMPSDLFPDSNERSYDETPERGQKRPVQNDRDMTKEQQKRYVMLKRAKKECAVNNAKSVLTILVITFLIATIISSIGISCVNDLLAVHVPEKKDSIKTVTITEKMDTKDVVKTLKKAGVIKNYVFCTAAAKFLNYTDNGYYPGTYKLKRSMGLENMLNTVKHIGISANEATVTIMIPEGADFITISELFEKNQVITADKLLECINAKEYEASFPFLKNRTDTDKRVNRLDGYLYPDTYEFYIGETGESVVKKFLQNHKTKWTEEYDKAAKSRGLTRDEIIILASIVEKEAKPDEMSAVAAILFNRLNISMRLDCDSTRTFVNRFGANKTEAEKTELTINYDTYQRDGLPIGPICNPGKNAIEAVLYAKKSEYYYFIHDGNNVFRTARTLQEQEANIARYGVSKTE